MKHKIVSMLAAISITGTSLWAIPAAMATTATPEPTVQDLRPIINACAVAFKDYKLTGNFTTLDKIINAAPKDARLTIQLTCAAYGRGYYDGAADSRSHIA